MAKKKTKKTTPFYKKWQFVVIAGVAVVAVAVVACVAVAAHYENQRLDREDRERFTQLEQKMEKLQAELKARGEEWKLEKSCSKPHEKYYTGEAGSCYETLTAADSKTPLGAVKDIISNEISELSDPSYSNIDNKYFQSIDIGLEDVFCSLWYSSDNSSPFVACHGPSRNMYYDQR